MHKTKSEDIIGLLPVLGLWEGDALAGCQASFGIHPFSHPARSPHLSSSIEGCDLRLASSDSAPRSLARYLLMFSIGEGETGKGRDLCRTTIRAAFCLFDFHRVSPKGQSGRRKTMGSLSETGQSINFGDLFRRGMESRKSLHLNLHPSGFWLSVFLSNQGSGLNSIGCAVICKASVTGYRLS